jgi:tight adherence protein B
MRRTLLGLVTVCLTLAVAVPAVAAGGLELSEARGGAFPTKTFVLTLPERRVLGIGDVNITESGQPVNRLRVVPGDAAGARKLGVVLAIDVSLSMRGRPIEAAMQAARDFAKNRPGGQQLGVIFFARDPVLALKPTTDGTRIQHVLAAPPPLRRGTGIYDGAGLAIRALEGAGVSAGSVVVLSDGADTGSSLSQEAIGAAARRAHARIFTIGLRSRSFDGSTLSALADATSGRYTESSTRGLAALFSDLGQRFGNEYLVTYRSTSPLGQRVDVRVGVAGVSGTASTSYVAPSFARQIREPAAAKQQFWSSGAALAVVALIAAILIGGAVLLTLRTRRGTVQDRISVFTGPDDAALTEQAAELDFASARGRSERKSLVSRTASWAAFAEDVDIAQINASPERLAATAAVAGLGLAAVMVAVGNPILGTLFLLSPGGILIGVRILAARKRQAFEQQLADNLHVVASAMRSGHSFAGALAVAVTDADEPARSELQRIVTDERLGVPLDDAIGRVAKRTRSRELEYVGLIATIQRDTGGNTSEVVDRVTETIRERAELNREVRSLTAQGRLGGTIVSVLPLFVIFVMSTTQPGYFDPMFHTTTGVIAMAIGVGLLAIGWIAIRKIVNIKV